MSTKSNKYLMVGSDPECFLTDKDGKLVSSIGIIPGGKNSPTKTKHGYILPDNITAEFNSTPADNVEDFVRNHNLILSDLREVITPLDLNLNFIASVLADESLLSDPEARESGCMPDFNAWTLSTNPIANYSESNVRAAGGHLHISFDQSEDDSVDNRARFVRALDLVLGVPSVIVDGDTLRRDMYGKAGCFRPKNADYGDPYNGVEYRTLSNFWVSSDNLMRWAFNGVEEVYKNLDKWSSLAESRMDDVINTINTSSKKDAILLCKEFGVKYAIN
jgi:hypothetical protein